MFYGTVLSNDLPIKLNKQDILSPLVHISNAVISKGGDKPIDIFAKVKGTDYKLCTLQSNKQAHVILDLYFGVEQQVEFHIKGQNNSQVHLTGYYEHPDDDFTGDSNDEDKVKALDCLQQKLQIQVQKQQQQQQKPTYVSKKRKNHYQSQLDNVQKKQKYHK